MEEQYMKKILSTAMAIAMMASMVAMASAKVGSLDTTTYITNDNNQVVVTAENIAYGKTIYMPLLKTSVIPDSEPLTGEESNIVTDNADIKSLSAKATWDMNGSAVANTEVVKKKDIKDKIGRAHV